MFAVIQIIILLFIHWVCDFVLQDEYWAQNKWKSWSALFAHTLTYSILFGVIGVFLGVFPAEATNANLYFFVLITLGFHTLVDAITSRITHRQHVNKRYGSPIPNLGLFTTIGFDQLLHYAQIFITYKLLFL